MFKSSVDDEAPTWAVPYDSSSSGLAALSQEVTANVYSDPD